MCAGAAAVTPVRGAVRELRQARRNSRLGRVEWFEVAYRAYLVVLLGGAVLGVVAGWLPSSPVSAATSEQVVTHGPGVVGLVAAVMVGVGWRSGAAGGPIAVEAADVRWLLLAPVPRRTVLLRPCTQRLGSLAAAGATTGAAAGVLAASHLGGSRPTWLTVGAAIGALLSLGSAAVALVVHATGMRAVWARTVATGLVAVQTLAVVTERTGPFDAVGDAALWPVTQRTSSLLGGLAATVVVAAVTVGGLAGCGSLSPEKLERRTALVAQLRFAIAVGDLRTVMLIRRQLTQDQLRARPWFQPIAYPARPHPPLWWAIWRGAIGMTRLPLRRVCRMVVVAMALGILAAAVVEGTVGLILAMGAALFVLGLDITEALAQTVDEVDQRELFPVPAGLLHVGLVVAPAVVLVPLAALATATAWVVTGDAQALAVGAVVAVPLAWAGACGAVVNVMRAAPDPMVRAARALAMPPEVAGVSTMVQIVWPLAVSVGGVTPLLFVTVALDGGGSLLAAAVRGAVACLLCTAATVMWVRRRDDARRRWRALVAAGDQARRDATRRRRQRTGGVT
jgi:hypothetical protein